MAVKRNFFRFALPLKPIDIRFAKVLFNFKFPLIVLGIIAAIGTLRPRELPDFAGLDPFGGFVDLGISAILRTDHENFAGLLLRVVDVETFHQVTRHRFFAIDVFAGVHGVEATCACQLSTVATVMASMSLRSSNLS